MLILQNIEKSSTNINVLRYQVYPEHRIAQLCVQCTSGKSVPKQKQQGSSRKKVFSAVTEVLQLTTMKKQFLIAMSIAALLGACSSSKKIETRYNKEPSVQELFQGSAPAYPSVKFAHMSDLHVFDKTLGFDTPDFQEYLRHDRKMLRESEEIIQAMFSGIQKQKVNFLILSGDLTKDGERHNHEFLVAMLKKVEAAGTPVYVIPGNHDLRSGDAFKYTQTGKERIPSVELSEFAEIYNDFGYSTALARDPNSLSYIAEPTPGLLLFALDSTKAQQNDLKKHPITYGHFTKETMAWIEEQLIQARRNGKPVVAMMHHGIIDHYTANKKYYGEYLVDNNDAVAEVFAKYGVRVVFTGHYHAQDITLRKFDHIAHNPVLYDIEVGSPVTYPSPYRMYEIKDNTLRVTSHRVQSIPSQKDFQKFANQFVLDGTEVMAKDIMAGYNVSAKDQDYMAPLVAVAYVAHLGGDEDTSKKPLIDKKKLGFMGGMVLDNRKPLIDSWWEDLAPVDNELVIDLK